MDKDKQRIAIAKACGNIIVNGTWTTEQIVACGAIHDMKDYLNDLNAMHEAVTSIKFSQNPEWSPLEYTDTLLEVVNFSSPHRTERGAFYHTNATAAQRAEAFLKTIGKWEEDGE